jgi:hypothetical protein
LTTGSNIITCSFISESQLVNITVGAAYSFTHSNLPGAGNSAEVMLYINNTATLTSSLSFPSSWVNVGGSWPTSITSSKKAVISLLAYDTTAILGTFNVQL